MHFQLVLVLFLFSCSVSSTNLFNDTVKTALCLFDFTPQNTLTTTCDNVVNVNCSRTNSVRRIFRQLYGTIEPTQLICKNRNTIILSWNKTTSVTFFEYYLKNFQRKRSFTQPISCNRMVLSNLQPNSTYEIRRWEVSHRNDTYVLKSSDFSTVTMPTFSDRLLPIPSFKLVNVTTFGASYGAIVSWTPAADMPCCYRLDAFGVTIAEQVSNDTCDLGFPPYEAIIRGLAFEETYNVTIRAIIPNKVSHLESPPSYVIVDIPSCLATYSNLTICAPAPPKNVRVSIKTCYRESKECDVIISWETPKLTPDNYTILMKNIENFYFINKTVSGMDNSTILKDLPIGSYILIIRAYSPAGHSKGTVVDDFAIHIDNFNVNKLAIALPAVAAIIIITGIAFVVLKKRHIRNFSTPINNIYAKEYTYYDKFGTPKEKDEWEIPIESITMEETLGEGAFGLVKKGILKKTNEKFIEVAIKMLKSHANVEEARQLYHEIHFMKTVGIHPNLVSMIGCVTNGLNAPLLLVEYCPKGDLQKFLRKEWERLNTFAPHSDRARESDRKLPNYSYLIILSPCGWWGITFFYSWVHDRLYSVTGTQEMHQSLGYRDANREFSNENIYNVFNKVYAIINNAGDFLTSNDLLSFARQVTLGMEHLAKLKLLHRDLAARNVLVLDNKLVKVSDFGLSRDVYQNNIYHKKGNGRLPIRWMALESITHQTYTTQSDVWSFGILLWEIVTMGECPYPGVSNADLLDLLKKGYRMEKPPHCDCELYNIMLNCWKVNPKERPTFTELKKQLEALLEDTVDYIKL